MLFGAKASHDKKKRKEQERRIRYSNFIQAIEKGDDNIANVKKFHHSTFVVSSWNCQTSPPIYFAASKGYTEIVKYLLDRGHSPVTANQFGYRPLCVAAARGNLKIVALLLSKYSNFQKEYYISNEVDRDTPLHFAALGNHLDVVMYLIENGVSVNKTNYSMESALHIAARKGHEEIVKYLCSNGADINLEDKNGKTPLFVAADNLSDNVKDLLRGVDYSLLHKMGR